MSRKSLFLKVMFFSSIAFIMLIVGIAKAKRGEPLPPEHALKDFVDPILVDPDARYRVEWEDGFFDNGHGVTKATIDLAKQTTVNLRKGSLDFSRAVFVDSMGNMVKKIKMTTIEYDNYNIISAGLDFCYKDGNRTGILQSGGLIDFDFTKDGKPLSLKKGSHIKVTYPVDDTVSDWMAKQMRIYSYDESRNKWQYESKLRRRKIDNKEYFDFAVTHLSYWNIDAPIKEHACVKGKAVIDGENAKLPIIMVARGLDYIGTSVRDIVNTGEFAIDVKRNSKIAIYAICASNKTAGTIPLYEVGNKRGSSLEDINPDYKYDVGEIILSKVVYNELVKLYRDGHYYDGGETSLYWLYRQQPD